MRTENGLHRQGMWLSLKVRSPVMAFVLSNIATPLSPPEVPSTSS